MSEKFSNNIRFYLETQGQYKSFQVRCVDRNISTFSIFTFFWLGIIRDQTGNWAEDNKVFFDLKQNRNAKETDINDLWNNKDTLKGMLEKWSDANETSYFDNYEKFNHVSTAKKNNSKQPKDNILIEKTIKREIKSRVFSSNLNASSGLRDKTLKKDIQTNYYIQYLKENNQENFVLKYERKENIDSSEFFACFVNTVDSNNQESIFYADNVRDKNMETKPGSKGKDSKRFEPHGVINNSSESDVSFSSVSTQGVTNGYPSQGSKNASLNKKVFFFIALALIILFIIVILSIFLKRLSKKDDCSLENEESIRREISRHNSEFIRV